MSTLEKERLQTHSPTILLVDDCNESREVLSIVLAPLECRLEQASSGEDALARVEGLNPAVILLDVSMPGLNGFEVCQRLRERPQTESVPILFISALGDLESRVKGLKGGGVDYIAKPFDPEEVLARVNTHLELYRLRQELLKRNAELESLLIEKDRFLDLAAHGLRHPVLQIRGLIGLLRSGQLGEQGRETMVKTIAQAAETMNSLLNDVLEVHDLESGDIQLQSQFFSPNEVLQDLLDVWQHRAEHKGIRIVAKTETVADIFYDREKFGQVLETILAQTLESTKPRSEITVTLSPTEDGFQFAVSRKLGEQESFDSVFSGLTGPAKKTAVQTLGNAILGKLIYHFGGNIKLVSEQDVESLILELPQ